MSIVTVLLIIGAAMVAVAYQAWVLARIARFPGYSQAQRGVQLDVVLLVPLLGALIAHLAIYGSTSKPKPRDKNFIPEDNAMS